MNRLPFALLLLAAGCATGPALVAPPSAEEPRPAEAPPEEEGNANNRARLDFLEKNLVDFETADGSTSLWFGVRFQVRYENLKDRPLDPGDQPSHESRGVTLNRGRLKLGGHALAPWLDIYSEYNVVDWFFLDYRVTVKADERLNLRVGQWKADYDRERIDSSGKQQMVDRSIVTYWFTIDRQLGASVFGRLGAGGGADSSYWLELLSGQGRGQGWGSGEWMVMGRYQWNPFGRVLPFSQSDVARLEDPAGSLSLAAAAARTKFTRFSSAGGGQLPGFGKGDYLLTQVQQGAAYHHRGFSFQQELHVKRIEDEESGDVRRLWGGYAQAGYFLSELLDWWPEPLELAARFAHVDPDTSLRGEHQNEISIGANWFFKGHRNKLTLGLGRHVHGVADQRRLETLLQLQWDISL